MERQKVVGGAEWLAAREALLAAEKDFTRQRDELARLRRDMPWRRVEQDYVFDGPNGPESLGDLFAGRSQLIVYHFMFAPEWERGCKSCSFWADHFDGVIPHLNARDATLVAISRAPREKLAAQAARLGWRFRWLSSGGTGFNYDYDVSFERPAEGRYNYQPRTGNMTDLPGFSVFAKDAGGAVYHTYSCYARGIDMLNETYNLLDILPKGRDEAGLPFPMAWVRLHDEYAAAP
jgi:predicted dithiol-disulfide oxidoreductase (DUF899 family)